MQENQQILTKMTETLLRKEAETFFYFPSLHDDFAKLSVWFWWCFFYTMRQKPTFLFNEQSSPPHTELVDGHISVLFTLVHPLFRLMKASKDV